ncbi:MAG: KpsF/GutQ family sugar-phosphate isomerase [Bacteroidales bacterium]|nr:KpsF/GutQ family sugar-phosphate isomerase [Bacteroidales bacterium]HPD96295.1 KpsF/GutQ family sugar-phosphate isomerase [Tenuifilaceae bacterium]HRX30257.1 KpsF/GutQ family sugar-phosphate isomerase [Tenuifilaceae bacterium]
MNVDIKSVAKQVINSEAAAIEKLAGYIDDDFERVVLEIFNGKGRVIVTGIGKSAIIANKIVATFNSTGTPAIFMHAADAIHGDLGIIQPDDIIICLSKSGNTPEIKVLAPLIKNLGNKLVALVSNTDSYLAQMSDYILKATVDREASPNNLAPTTSTTAQLVIGDALAVCLLKLKGFTTEDFARFHPGGSLGKKLYMRVSDIFIENEVPKVKETDTIRKIILEISSKRLGATAVLDIEGNLIGIITDGDLRRMLERNVDFDKLSAKDIMSPSPKTVSSDELAINAFNIMEQHKITQLLVTDNGKYKGVIHLHDILREGIV